MKLKHIAIDVDFPITIDAMNYIRNGTRVFEGFSVNFKVHGVKGRQRFLEKCGMKWFGKEGCIVYVNYIGDNPNLEPRRISSLLNRVHEMIDTAKNISEQQRAGVFTGKVYHFAKGSFLSIETRTKQLGDLCR